MMRLPPTRLSRRALGAALGAVAVCLAAVGLLLDASAPRVRYTMNGFVIAVGTYVKPLLKAAKGTARKLGKVEIDQEAQARAYAALLGSLRETEGFAGTFVWRMYADVSDMSQEAEWGFSPWGKRSEQVLRDAYRQHWWGDDAAALPARPLPEQAAASGASQ